jgi:hypothetical protein
VGVAVQGHEARPGAAAGVVLAVGEGRGQVAAPVHPHRFRPGRGRQIVRQTRSLPLAQKQAGWSRLEPAFLALGDDEARELLRRVEDRRPPWRGRRWGGRTRPAGGPVLY